MRISPTFGCVPSTLLSMLLISGCASGKVTDRPDHFIALQAGERSAFEVYNPTACPANVFLRHTTGARRDLGTVPAYGRENFEVADIQGGAVIAQAIEPDGRICGGTLQSRVQVRRLDSEARPAVPSVP